MVVWLRLKVISGVCTGEAHVVAAAALATVAVTGEPGSVLGTTAEALAVIAELEKKPDEVGTEEVVAERTEAGDDSTDAELDCAEERVEVADDEPDFELLDELEDLVVEELIEVLIDSLL